MSNGRNWGNTEIERLIEQTPNGILVSNTSNTVYVMQLKQSVAFMQLTVGSDNKFSDSLVV